MGKEWLRAIDSAQRTVVLDQPRAVAPNGLERVVFDIQGVAIFYRGGSDKFLYTDMAALGIHGHGQPPLTVWQRLMRRPASIGEIALVGERIQVSFWSRPKLALVFDLGHEDDRALWRECEIMTLSAGFHFRLPPSTEGRE